MKVFSRFLFFLLLSPSWSEELSVSAAAELSFLTEKGIYYELQHRPSLNEKWERKGVSILGDGEKHSILLSGNEQIKDLYRLRRLKNEWALVWQDEFSGESLDYTQWGKEENNYGGGNNEAQYYSTDEKYVYVKDGKLHIAVYRDARTSVDGKTSHYTSGRIRTLNRGDWKYGRIEVRAKMPGGEGIWPAVWMLPTESPYGTWAAGGEIDIIESKGNETQKTYGTLHFGGKWPKNTHKGGSYTLPEGGFHSAFHTYAVEWHKDRIDWFVNGEKYQTIKKEEWHSEAAPDSETAPFDQPFHLIMNVAVNGGFFNGTTQDAKNLPDSAFPQVLEVDYVRVFQWAE